MSNNPYSLIENRGGQHLLKKNTVLFTQSNANTLRQNDSFDNSLSFQHYPHRQPSRGHLSPMAGHKSFLDESNPNFKQQSTLYSMEKEGKSLGAVQKNQGSSSSSNLQTIRNVGARNQIQRVNSIEKMQMSRPITPRENLSTSNFEINQNIQNLNAVLKKHEKRIFELERSHISNSKLTVSNISEDALTIPTSELHQIQTIISRIENEWRDSHEKNREELSRMREQIQICVKPSEMERMISEKMLFFTPEEKMKENEPKHNLEYRKEKSRAKDDDNNLEFSNKKAQKTVQDSLLKQVGRVKEQLLQKINLKNIDLSQCIERIQKQMKELYSINSIPSVYKSSAIKCSNTAILLRFAESFRVRKHGTKTGEVKITITDNTYYIDAEGFLLDKEQNYLLDGRGKQVRLEERHLKLLREQKILV